MYQYESDGEFEQNQLIVNANVRIGSKVSLFGWYTLNNVNANTTGASSFPNNQYDLAQNYGPTSYDVRNRAFVGGTIALPRGIRVNPFLVMSSGIPFNITLGQDYNGDSIFNDRPTFATPGQTGPNIVVTKWGTFNLTPQPGQTVIPPYYGMGPGRFSLNLEGQQDHRVRSRNQEWRRHGGRTRRRRAWPRWRTWPWRRIRRGARAARWAWAAPPIAVTT